MHSFQDTTHSSLHCRLKVAHSPVYSLFPPAQPLARACKAQLFKTHNALCYLSSFHLSQLFNKQREIYLQHRRAQTPNYLTDPIKLELYNNMSRFINPLSCLSSPGIQGSGLSCVMSYFICHVSFPEHVSGC